MQYVRAGQENTVSADLTDGFDPITSGSVSHYLKALSGSNYGKWWDGSSQAWSSTEAIAGAGTHDGHGHWVCQIVSQAWTAGGLYETYAVHADGEQIDYRTQVFCLAAE